LQLIWPPLKTKFPLNSCFQLMYRWCLQLLMILTQQDDDAMQHKRLLQKRQLLLNEIFIPTTSITLKICTCYHGYKSNLLDNNLYRRLLDGVSSAKKYRSYSIGHQIPTITDIKGAGFSLFTTTGVEGGKRKKYIFVLSLALQQERYIYK